MSDLSLSFITWYHMFVVDGSDLTLDSSAVVTEVHYLYYYPINILSTVVMSVSHITGPEAGPQCYSSYGRFASLCGVIVILTTC